MKCPKCGNTSFSSWQRFQVYRLNEITCSKCQATIYSTMLGDRTENERIKDSLLRFVAALSFLLLVMISGPLIDFLYRKFPNIMPKNVNVLGALVFIVFIGTFIYLAIFYIRWQFMKWELHIKEDKKEEKK